VRFGENTKENGLGGDGGGGHEGLYRVTILIVIRLAREVMDINEP
jgi:hypothetical protein